MSWLEWIATLLGILCVALSVVRSVWTFPTAIGSVALLGWVVFRQRLYSDAILQVFFAAANAYGWLNWSASRAEAGEVVVERLTLRARWAWAGAGVLATIGWGAAMHRFTDAAYPWWDAATAIASMIAQLLMAQRKLENWWIWIGVDLALVPLYAIKHLWAFAGLYVIYLALSAWGLRDWQRAARAS